MSNYNWCHGPECHTQETQSRVRGSGDNKVLRTRRIRVYKPEEPHIYDFFCNQSCLMDFMRTHITSIIAIAPRREALETPIKIEKEKHESYRYEWSNDEHRRVPYISTRTTIRVDNDNG